MAEPRALPLWVDFAVLVLLIAATWSVAYKQGQNAERQIWVEQACGTKQGSYFLGDRCNEWLGR